MNNPTYRANLLTDFLSNSAQRYPGRPALLFHGVSLSYAEIEDRSNRFANSLLARGFQRHDRAVILLDNSPQAIIALFGILKAGGIFSFANPTTTKERLTCILDHCQASTFITDQKHFVLARDLIILSPYLKTIWICGLQELTGSHEGACRSFEEDIGQASSICPDPVNIDLDLAALIYTSGSTGQPRGVMLTHSNMVAAASSINEYLQNTPEDLILDALPFSFDYGLYQIFLAFQAGACVMLEESFFYPYAILRRMSEAGVTAFPGIPTMFAMLFKFKRDPLCLPNLRYVTNTGAALPPAFSNRLQKLFPGARIFSMYGLTECKRVAYLPPEELAQRPTSVGKAMPNVEVILVNEQGNEVPRGQVGELVVRGSNVMRGYWHDPESTRQALRPGRYPGEIVLYSGDLFQMDEDGYLYFVSRKDDLIKSRGQLVSPREIEDVLYELSEISEAKVTGIADEMQGQAIRAIVALQPGTSLRPDDILRHCAQRLENHKVPHVLEIVDALPKTETGKLTLSTQQPSGSAGTSSKT